MAALLFLFVVIPLFAALFFWLTSLFGPMTAALVRRGGRLDPRALALLPLVVGRRPASSPRAPDDNASARVAVGADNAIDRAEAALLSAFLLAVALGMMARGCSSEK